MDNSFCSSSPASALIVQNCVNKDQQLCKRDGGWSEWRPWPTPDPNKLVFLIPNGCLDAYEVKVKKDIFKYQENVKLISQFQRFFSFFNGLLELASLP